MRMVWSEDLVPQYAWLMVHTDQNNAVVHLGTAIVLMFWEMKWQEPRELQANGTSIVPIMVIVCFFSHISYFLENSVDRIRSTFL